MAGFLYYLPGIAHHLVTPELLVTRGLEMPLRDLLPKLQPGHNVTVAPISRGPDGQAGTYLYPQPATGNLPRVHGVDTGKGAHGQSQVWEDHGGYWLGIDTGRPPTPADLARPLRVAGEALTLGDGQEWECPVLREPRWDPQAAQLVLGTNLPLRWGENGSGFTQSVLPEWEWAWELSGRIWDVFVGAEDMETPEAWEVVCELLSINYRLGKREITRLGLVTSENYSRIFKAAVDAGLLEAAAAEAEDTKKNEPAGASSSPGAGTPDPGHTTAPAGRQST